MIDSSKTVGVEVQSPHVIERCSKNEMTDQVHPKPAWSRNITILKGENKSCIHFFSLTLVKLDFLLFDP